MELVHVVDICAALLAPAPDATAGLAASDHLGGLLTSVTDAGEAPNIAAGAAGAAGTSVTPGGGGPSGSDLAHSMGQDAAIGTALGAAKTAPGVSAGVGTVLTVITAAGVGAEGIIHIKKSRGVYGRNSNAGRQAMEAAGVTW